MIEQEITLLTNGRISFQKCGNGLQFGYSKNRGVYSIKVKTSGEWNGLTIRAFWHIPDIKEPITSLLVDNVIRVPALVTSYKGEGRIVFEGSDGAKTVTSADVRYYVNKNSGTCDGTIPEPGTPAWQELVGTVKKYSDTAVEAKESAKKSADEAKQALEDTKDVKSQAIEEINSSKTAAIEEIENKKNLSIEEINSVKEDAKGELEALCDSTRDFANQAKEAADKAKASEDASKKNADDSAATLQELKDGIASGDFKGDKGDPGPAGKDAPQIDDTTVTDSAPWSSKHIVDMLCPPLDETGNPAQCYPVEGYPLGVTASWEPVQEGSGDPSPDNIRPIHGRDSVQVERCGENLLNISPFTKLTQKGITYEYAPDGGIRMSGTALNNSDSPTFSVWHLPPGKYCGPNLGNKTSPSIVVKRNGNDVWIGAGGTFEILAGDVINYWYLYTVSGTTTDKTIYPYIVPGTTAPTTYAPYIGQTATLTLPRTIYGGTVDAVTGEGQETWGTETISRIASIDELTSVVRCAATLLQKSVTAKSGSAISNWLGEYVSYVEDKESFYTNQTQIYIKISKTRLSSFDVAGVNAYLSEHPLTVCYKLASPVPITATGAQPIPALSGVNTVLTDADSATVTGRADPIKRITDLEDAVASMTDT